MIILDSRLNAILNFVPLNSRVADIGTDHGYLAIELIKKNIVAFVIASDKNRLPLESARQNVCTANVENKVDLRLGDGLQTLNVGEADVICIAGIGGSLMCNILSDKPDIINSVNKMILQPMNAVDKVRRWIECNNWIVEDEDLAEVDGIIYEILCISKYGKPAETTKKSNSPLLKKFIQNKIDKLQKIIDEMSKSSTARESKKYFQLQKQIETLKIYL